MAGEFCLSPSHLVCWLTHGQSTEARLQADFRTVQSERAKLQQLIESLNNVSAENERTRAEDRAKAESRVEELQREA